MTRRRVEHLTPEILNGTPREVVATEPPDLTVSSPSPCATCHETFPRAALTLVDVALDCPRCLSRRCEHEIATRKVVEADDV